IVRDETAEMAALLRRLAAEARFDVVHADQLSMAPWGLLAAEAAAQRPRTVLDEHNAIYKLTERIAAEATALHRLIARREARAFHRYEAAMLRAYDAVLAVTEEDRRHLLALWKVADHGSQVKGPLHPSFTTCSPEPSITVIPICVDPEAVQPIKQRKTASPLFPFSPSILHLGTMFWPPNVAGVLWFAREVLPRVWERLPTARFVVVGKNPPAAVQALSADSRVLITGYVPDPRPYLETADVFIVPLFSGSGMRVKILDAWLWGLPIVSTPIGAEGIEVRDGENILIAADAAAFADAVVRVLTDATLNRRLRTEGRRWVEARYDWRLVYRQVDAVYDRLLADR
ncbi:MAG: glycosyltransferase family 4 protein, partial [Anaerolineae bacterium]|nr:glycosyltransferase family 4 protein [Anaerolineae bacterium]